MGEASLSSCRPRQRRTVLHRQHNKTRGRHIEPTKSEYNYSLLTETQVNAYITLNLYICYDNVINLIGFTLHFV